MFKNYVTVAWRRILRNKLYSAINILGLVVGLSVFLFGSLLANYEKTHDVFFENSARIFTVGTLFSPKADIGISKLDSAHSVVGPLIKTDVPEIEYVARTIRREMLFSIANVDYYQVLRFADADLLRIFDFTFVEGNNTALDAKNGLVITESVARRYFGAGSALGRSIELDHDKVLNVTAVVEDLPAHTHFNSSLVVPAKFEMVAHISVLNTEDNDMEKGDWNNLSLGDLTYLLVPEGTSQTWLQSRLDGVFTSHYPGEDDMLTGFEANRLQDANTFLWSAIGMPVIETVQLLAILVLVISIVNYTNLATAQALGRTREVGLRKTMGANRRQLLIQFLIESVLIAGISMVIALFVLEIAVPLFNTALGKSVNIDYTTTLPWLVLTAMVVGLIAGAYPAYLITQTSPISALRGMSHPGISGAFFRSLMLGVQFAISIFMLAIVLVVYFQNNKLQQSGDVFPRAEIVSLERLSVPEIQSRLDTLKNEISAISGVTGFGYSSQIPFQQSNSNLRVSPTRGDDLNVSTSLQVSIDPGFFETYDIQLLQGRQLGMEISDDTMKEGVLTVNVVVNEMMLERLGYTLSTENPVFHDVTGEEKRTYSIVGVIPDQNFRGFHNQVKAMVFLMSPTYYGYASLRIQGRDFQSTLAEVESVWDEIVPEYPIQMKFLNETFNDVFKIYSAITLTLTGFAFVAMTLSMVGLFGLAAFMVEQRTREIGIRKVMGANMIWRFSKPVMWASLVALPAAYFGSSTYLDFFADRLFLPGGIVVIAGILAVFLSWVIVSIHVVRIAKINPIHSLRYE